MKKIAMLCLVCLAGCGEEVATSVAAETTTTQATTTTTAAPTTTTTSTTTAPPSTTTTVKRTTTTRANRGGARTPSPGIAILERIAKCESGGSYTAANKHSTASGKYQVLDSTWGHYGGYSRAKNAPPEVQEQQAREMFARSGTRPWAASKGCWN